MYSSLDKAGKWMITTTACTSWLQVARALVREVRTQLFNAAVDDAQTHAGVVEKHIPKYDHYINDAMFSHSLARKHLTPATSRYDLGAETVVLFQCIKQLGVLSEKFSLEDPRQSSTSKDALHYADVVFGAARDALTVTAAVSCCLNFSGEEQKSAAIKILASKHQHFPKSLVAALQEKAGGIHPQTQALSAA
jgi:hypothetical protein